MFGEVVRTDLVRDREFSSVKASFDDLSKERDARQGRTS